MHSTREVTFDPVRNSQQVFRFLLDSMARPGKVVTLPHVNMQIPTPWSSGLGMIALTLLDQEVTFAPVGDGTPALTDYLQHNTMAKAVPADRAEFVFAGGSQDGLADLIRQLRLGTLEQPDTGATLVLDVARLLPETEEQVVLPDALSLTLWGPGINGARSISLTGLDADVLVARVEVNAGFPMGFDLILVDPAGQVVSLPRTTRCRVEV